MKVAYLVNQFPMPSQTFIRREIEELERRGIDVKRFALRPWDGLLVDAGDIREQQQTLYVQNVRKLTILRDVFRALFRCPKKFLSALTLARRCSGRSDKTLFIHFAYFVEACVLLRFLNATRVEHLHAHFGVNSTDVAMLCHALGGPSYSFTVHGFEEMDRADYLNYEAKVGGAKFVSVIASFVRSQIMRRISPSQWSKLQVIRCAVGDEYLDHVITEVPPVQKLTCVGRLCKEKGQLLLIEAASILKSRGLDFQLILVGDGEMRREIESAIDQASLSDCVQVTGWATGKQVREYILQSKALLLPSFIEGLPVVIMESLALGRPVISTYVAGIPELVRNGENGWLVPAGDVAALVQAMGEVLQTSVERLTGMGRVGREAVQVRHNIHTEVDKLVKLFERAIVNQPIDTTDKSGIACH